MLDANGWASVEEIIAKAGPQRALTEDLIREVVAHDEKQRYALSDDGRRIRANQGHTIDVDLQLNAIAPPSVLYHGTATRFIQSIETQGLRPRRRQYVHLSSDAHTAVQVGRRHGEPVVLEVAAGDMYAQGCLFYLSENGVWLTDKVAARFLRRLPVGARPSKSGV